MTPTKISKWRPPEMAGRFRQYVCHASAPCENGWADRGLGAWGKIFWKPQNVVVIWSFDLPVREKERGVGASYTVSQYRATVGTKSQSADGATSDAAIAKLL